MDEPLVLNIARLSAELRRLLSLLEAGRFREVQGFESLPADLLRLKGVVLTGITESTHCPSFEAMIQELARVREMSRFPEFKIVLITDGKELNLPGVQLGLRHFLPSDEIWIQLDCATLPYQIKSAPSASRLESAAHQEDRDFIHQILSVAAKRPVVIQSAFFAMHGEAPSDSEIKNYIRHLKRLRRCGANIALVQVYSPAPKESKRAQLKLKTLSLIARRIRENTGLHTEFF